MTAFGSEGRDEFRDEFLSTIDSIRFLNSSINILCRKMEEIIIGFFSNLLIIFRLSFFIQLKRSKKSQFVMRM